ncbi:hypothetical protein F5878DRAFT_549930, partial [Lentinula raphanica]
MYYAIKELQDNEGVRFSPYEDFFHGSEYLEKVIRGEVGNNDVFLVLSIDGAQLYRYKASNCWIYIWLILDCAPDVRYKKDAVLPGGFIPGPGKPRSSDSFIFPGLYHLAALQCEGLSIWN